MFVRKSSGITFIRMQLLHYVLAFFLFISIPAIVGCDNNSSVSVPISQKAVAFKKKVKKTVADSLKVKQANPKSKSHHGKNQNKSLKITTNDKNKIKKIHYTSNIAKLRDPFIPFIKFNEKTAKGKIKKPLSPLQRYALSQLTLIAVIDAGKRGRWAMVQDSSGKGFTIREGMPLGSEGGVVRRILPDRIIIEQTKVDLLGKKKIMMVALKLHPEKKGE